MQSTRRAEGRKRTDSQGQEALKAAFVDKISNLMAARRLSAGELAANMGQRSPAPIYRLIGGKGSIGPRLVANLAGALDAEVVLAAYAAWQPRLAARARQIFETGSNRLSIVPKSIVTWLQIDEIERNLRDDAGWEVTVVSLGVPAAAIDRRVRGIVCDNVAAGRRYRYVVHSDEPWLDQFEQTLRDRLETYDEVAGEIVCYVDPNVVGWSLVSRVTPVLELLTFKDDRSPEAYLLVSNEILKDDNDRFAVQLDDRLAVRLESDALYRERGKGITWDEKFKLNKKTLR